MITLDNSRTLEAALAAATTSSVLDVMASYEDSRPTEASPATTLTSVGGPSGTSGIQLVPAAANGLPRNLIYLSVRNADSLPHVLTLQVNSAGTRTTIWRGSLASGDTLFYEHREGFYVLDGNGARKQTSSSGAGSGGGGGSSTMAAYNFTIPANQNYVDLAVSGLTTDSVVVMGLDTATPDWVDIGYERMPGGAANTLRIQSNVALTGEIKGSVMVSL